MDNDNMELSDNYPEEHLQGLYNMWEQDQLCDVTILVEGRKFCAHKTVAATGHYFLKMFTSGFRESSAQEITIEGSAAAFEILLNFVYTGRVDRTKVASCMIEVIEMACYMQFTEFVNICSTAVQKLLKASTEAFSVSDICKVMQLAKTHDLTVVYQATHGYFEDKIESLKSSDMFLENISVTCLQDLLCHENLSNADEEDQVLELVINWMKHDWEKRKEYSHQLLQKVRLGLVASEDIKKLIGPEILDIPKCSELVNRALDLHASNKPKEILAIENPDIAAPQSTIMAPVILNDGKVKYYDVKQKEWTTMNKMDPLPSKSTAKNIYELIVVKGILYAAGGINGREFLKYQASENKWIPLPSKILQKIVGIQLVAFGAYIYAFGACCPPKDQLIERYDISAEKWDVLKQKDSYGSCTSLEVIETHGRYGKCKCSVYSRREIFAFVFEGKIMVSGFYLEVDWENNTNCDEWGELLNFHLLEGEMVIFDPVMNTYQIKDVGGWGDCETKHGEWDNTCFKPTLFVHEDQLYLMGTEFKGSDSPVTVHKVHVTEKDGKITGVGYNNTKRKTAELLHELPDEEDDAPFYVQDKIFVKQSRRKKAGHGKVKKAGHGKVKSFPQYGEKKQLMYVGESDLFYPVWFSFEKKLTVLDSK